MSKCRGIPCVYETTCVTSAIQGAYQAVSAIRCMAGGPSGGAFRQSRRGDAPTIESVQDAVTEFCKYSESDACVQVSFGTAWSASANASSSQAGGSYAAVNQQSGLFAGKWLMKNSEKDMYQFLEAMCVSTEQYRARMDGGIYTRLEDVPDLYRPRLEKDSDGTGTRDYIGMLQRGKDWIIEPLRTLQPHSFQVFHDVVGPLQLGIVLIPPASNVEAPPKARPIMFFDASGRMVEVRPSFSGSTYEDGNDSFGSLRSLPDALAKSWLWRTQGWRMPSEPFQGPLVNRRLIGHPSGDWLDADSYLDTLGRGWKKKYLPSIVERFPDSVTNKNGIKRFKFRCFLDTRPAGLGGPVGDQFFVCSTRRDQVVYHIQQGNIDDIRILRDPADAIDRYCAHVLRRVPGEFDFSPWSEPLPR